MSEVMDASTDALDRPNRLPSPTDGSPPPPPPPPPRRRDRDSRERRDDYYDSRNRSPPPPPPPARDRDYRRRSSPSPPPYRDRRHSPPRRSPPPGGFKRSRREDGGYDRRRGSPRYANDYGGYDRGGRGGYEERSYGRYMNRSSDWLEMGRGGFEGSQPQREGLMTYKQFIQELEDDILPAEAEKRYEEYRTEYISTQKRAYFETHKDEEWLKDKYHPTNLVAVIERRNENARNLAKEILLDLQSGTLDIGPSFTSSMSNKSGNASDPNSEDESEVGGKRRRHGRGPAKENDVSAAPKAHLVSCEPRRIQVDLEQAQSLVRKLDTEKGIEDNILSSTDHDKLEAEKSHGGSMGPIIIIRGLTTVKGLEGAELLDTLLTYLWRAHGLDYYGMTETNEAKGLRHVRPDNKTFDVPNTSGNGADWEMKLDLFWRQRLQGQDPLEIMTAKEKLDAAAIEVLDPYVRKIRDEKYGWKYGCGAKGCTKLFHAAEFVHKHLRLKHPDLVMELTSKVRDDLYFQNYMNDPNAPGGTPIMQQSAPKDKAPRRRSVLDGRLKDERGRRSPSRDGSGGEDQARDAYGGQGLHGASPFSSDIPVPPQVLMPLPGAGPLGPFVPAPPDVAMRMMREQGGPSSLEANGGPRSRKGRSGPFMAPSGPILGIPPAFRPDPRRMRSYQDLDAPEDEVTVMDYRSL
ncbi:Serrate RNA effector molecule [Apostasia shenzhenica]|uniref:Serrate RNA effector molecule n=1 Tax=Apostasia shenzhenica TaxID=1088818 RepID=A0A2I0APS9_9ASPA|nr:Serrate RNA effector molecule [Apostasia shenzhenica]